MVDELYGDHKLVVISMISSEKLFDENGASEELKRALHVFSWAKIAPLF